MKKRRLGKILGSLLLVLTMAFVITACGEETPSDAANEYMDVFKDKETCRDAIEESTKEGLKALETEDESSDDLYKKLMIDTDFEENIVNIMGSMSYKTGDEKIDGDKAAVKVTVTTKNYGDEFVKKIESDFQEFLGRMVAQMMKEEEPDEEQMYADIFKFFGECLSSAEDNAESEYKDTVTLHMEKDDDGEWKIDKEKTDYEDIMNAVTGGIIDALDNVDEIAS